jgi:hypothetical protein
MRHQSAIVVDSVSQLHLVSIKSSPSVATVLTNRGVRVSISTVVASRQMRRRLLRKKRTAKENTLHSPQEKPVSPDVLVNNVGTLYTFCPLTLRAKEWIDEHVQDDAQWFGHALIVEHRYAWGLAQGMKDHGLVLA